MAKFTLDPKPKSAFTVVQKFQTLVISCTLCKFAREIDMSKVGAIKDHKEQFIADHKRSQKSCKGKK